MSRGRLWTLILNEIVGGLVLFLFLDRDQSLSDCGLVSILLFMGYDPSYFCLGLIFFHTALVMGYFDGLLLIYW